MKTRIIIVLAVLFCSLIYAAEIKEILVVGNSLAFHGPAPNIGWNNSCGMAASELAKDYPHLLFDKIHGFIPKQKRPPRLKIARISGETEMTGWDKLKNNEGDIIIIQLGDNYRGTKEVFQERYEQLIVDLRGKRKPFIVCLSNWSSAGALHKMIEDAARKHNCIFVSLAALADDPANRASSENRFENPSVGWHPGDRGMAAIADTVFTTIKPALSRLTGRLQLAAIFSDNAVLQRDTEIPVWGFAKAGEAITVNFAGQSVRTITDNNGKWMLKLAPLPASKENRSLEVIGQSSKVLVKNILVGEVWLASGQSNMEMTLWGSSLDYYRHRNANATGKEVAARTNLPLLRFVNMPKKWSQVPMEPETVKWCLAVPGKDLMNSSATAFFFARELQKELDIPIGILGAYRSESRIEPWISPSGFASVPELADIAKNVNNRLPGTDEYKKIATQTVENYHDWLEHYKGAIIEGIQPPAPPPYPPVQQRPYSNFQQPTVSYNGMLHAFVPYAIRGAIWYQGESNRCCRGTLYKSKMQALLNGWKQEFNNPNLKLYFVQLAPYKYNDRFGLTEMWAQQQAFADAEKDAGMIVISDAVHDINNVHPYDKEIVGKRLAYLALNRDYGRKDIKADSPRLKSFKVEKGKFILEFDFVESWTNIASDVTFFEVAGIDKNFVPAKVVLNATKLIVYSDKVANPISLRYMWHETYEGKLANEAGLVLGPFEVTQKP